MEEYGPEVSKRRGTTIHDVKKIIEEVPVLRDAVRHVEEMRKRIEGTSEKKEKKETPFGEYE